MGSIASLTAVFFILFYLLGKMADVVVTNLRRIGKSLGFDVYILGFILGAFTSLPELMVGINATINNVQSLSLGNLLGGNVVLFGFILAFSMLLNRRIDTQIKKGILFQVVLLLILPFILGLDGQIGAADGVILIILYLGLLYSLYHHKQKNSRLRLRTAHPRIYSTNIYYIIVGVVALMVVANLIVRLTMATLVGFSVPLFVIGMILYAFGTNLPEIIVMLRSWSRSVRDLSISNIIGSALANVFIIGFIAILKPVPVSLTASYWLLAVFSVALYLTFFVFSVTKKSLNRLEGAIMLAMFFAFLFVQVVVEGRL